MATYANKFTIELSDVGRIVFVDERVPAAKGLPMASTTAVEVVMTLDNLKALAEGIEKTISKHKP
jgi:hypothetical protein